MTSSLSELARIRDEEKREEASKASLQKSDSIRAANALAEELRNYYVKEKNLRAQIIQRDELIDITIGRRSAQIRFLNPTFVLLSTKSEHPESDVEESPMGPEHVLRPILDLFDV